MSWAKVATTNNEDTKENLISTKNKEEKESKIELDIENIRDIVNEKYSIELFDIAFNIKDYCDEYSPDILKKTSISNIIEFIEENIDYSSYTNLVNKETVESENNESDLEI